MKKGVGLSYDIGNWPNVKAKTGAGWFLNWSFSQARKEEAGQNYVPLWAYDYGEGRRDGVRAFAASWPGSYWLVGNEPNELYQDNMPAYQAGWTYNMAAKVILGADPAAKVYIGGVLNDADYMERMLGHVTEEVKSQLKGLHWHRYGWGEDAVNFTKFREEVNPMVALTRELGAQWDWRCWLSEFGVIGYGTEGIPMGQIVSFIKETVPWLEARDWLQRYAWFCWRKDDERQPFPVAELARPVYGEAYK